MNSILILLTIVALTFALSQTRLMRAVQGVLMVPLTIVAGFLLSKGGLFPLLPSTVESILPAVQCALVWVCFLAGLRMDFQNILTPNRLKFSLYSLFFLILFTMIAFALFQLIAPDPFGTGSLKGHQSLLMLAFLSGALMCGSSLLPTLSKTSVQAKSRHLDNLIITVAFTLALPFFMDHEISWRRWSPVFSIITIALILAIAIRLLLPKKIQLDTSQRLLLAGLIPLAAGWTEAYYGLEPLIGFYFGAFCSQFLARNLASDQKIRSTEAPFRLVVAFFAGLFLEVRAVAILLALLLALIRYYLKTRLQTQTNRITNWRLSGIALSLTLGLHLSDFSSQSQDISIFLLNLVCFSWLFTDLIFMVDYFSSNGFSANRSAQEKA